MKEKIIDVEPKNAKDICEFLDKSYGCVGYGGGLKIFEKMYSEGISFRTIDKNFLSGNFLKKYQIIIKSLENFTSETLD